MYKNFLLTFFFFFSLIAIIYPSKKENTKLFDYCYSLEKILSKNSIQKREHLSLKVKSISKDIAKYGVSKTRGVLINKMIDQYKTSRNSQIIKSVPNKIYCFVGYWIELSNPGTFELIFYTKSKKVINQFKDFNSEFKFIKKEFNNLF